MLGLIRHLIAWTRSHRLDAELRDEIEQHIEWKANALMADGVPEDEARRRAAVAVGNTTRLQEEARAMWGFPLIDSLLQDARYGLRQLRRSPVFTGVAVLSLAIAIGAGSAVFALSRAALFRPVAVVHPEQVLMLRWEAAASEANLFHSFDGSGSESDGRISGTSFAHPTLEHMMSAAIGSADLAGFADLYRVNMSVRGRPQLGRGQLVSGSYFPLLGVRAAAGRLLQPADDTPATTSVVISHRFWTDSFGADPGIVGTMLEVNAIPFTVVGVTDSGFSGTLDVGDEADLFVPFGARDRIVRDKERWTDPNYWWVLILARPRAGASADALRVRLQTVMQRDVRAAQPTISNAALPTVQAHPGAYGQPYTREALREPLRMMVLAVGVLLLIACANIAGLQVARAAAREHEMAVRLAIGAGRRRVARQLLIESLVLGVIGGAAGLVVARTLARLLVPALNLDTDAALQVRLDWATALFTTLVAIASGVVFGLAPAWRASRASASLVASGSLTGRGPADVPRLRLGRTLLVAQIGLSLALVFTAALFVQSLRRLHHVYTGFDARNLLLFTVNPILNGYDEARVLGYWREGVRRLRGVQGVLNATVTTHALIANSSSSSSFFYSAPDGSQQKVPLVYRLSVADDFFETMRIPLRFGRRIDARDSSRGVRAAVINETLARMAFPGVSPLGQRFQLSSRPNVPVYDVVGVVADARYATLRREVPAIAYISLAENPSPGPMTFYVRTAEEPGRIAHAIEDLMPGVDTSVPIYGFRTQEEQVERYLAQDRFFAGLGTVLGSAALLLACIGIYGLLSYSLARRTPELGIRLALGAAPADVIKLVFRESMIVAGTGILVGIPAAVAVARTARSTLFEVAVVSPVILALAVCILVAVAAFAVYLPARRAARRDPLTALRV